MGALIGEMKKPNGVEETIKFTWQHNRTKFEGGKIKSVGDFKKLVTAKMDQAKKMSATDRNKRFQSATNTDIPTTATLPEVKDKCADNFAWAVVDAYYSTGSPK